MTLTIVGLLVVVVGMNTVADMRAKQAQAELKEAKEAREKAEAAAKSAKEKTAQAEGKSKPDIFKLPANSGPAEAPVKVEVFLNTSKECQNVDISLRQIPEIYGDLVRLEWSSMSDPKVQTRADKMKLGCEAGMTVNGKIESEVERNGGRVTLSLRGPIGEKYKPSDLYTLINRELKAKGKEPPAAALTKASG
jgi:hypothetical protein